MVRRFLAICCLIASSHAFAEEGGSGHYFPGTMSSFIDGIPGEPGVFLRGQFIGYDGQSSASRDFPLAG